MKTAKELQNLLAMVHPDITTVRCTFRGKGDNKKEYVFKINRTLAEFVTEGTLLLADTQFGPAVVTAVSVDEEAQIESDAPFVYQWVFQVVDLTESIRLQDMDKEFADNVGKQQREQTRKALAEQYGITLDGLPSLPAPQTYELIED